MSAPRTIAKKDAESFKKKREKKAAEIYTPTKTILCHLLNAATSDGQVYQSTPDVCLKANSFG
jgi:hypothetical protein